jgi:hypothetical protein
VVLGLARLAPVPPSSLPPGAGNEPKYALNAELDRAKQTKEGYVSQAEIFERNLHAPAVRPHEDGDVAAMHTVKETQPGCSVAIAGGFQPAVFGSVAAAVKLRATPIWARTARNGLTMVPEVSPVEGMTVPTGPGANPENEASWAPRIRIWALM